MNEKCLVAVESYCQDVFRQHIPDLTWQEVIDVVTIKLKAQHLMALKLRYEDGLTYREIAERLGVSQSRARQVVHKTRGYVSHYLAGKRRAAREKLV